MFSSIDIAKHILNTLEKKHNTKAIILDYLMLVMYYAYLTIDIKYRVELFRDEFISDIEGVALKDFYSYFYNNNLYADTLVDLQLLNSLKLPRSGKFCLDLEMLFIPSFSKILSSFNECIDFACHSRDEILKKIKEAMTPYSITRKETREDLGRRIEIDLIRDYGHAYRKANGWDD